MSESGGDQISAATIELPEKTYFKIGEVAKLLEVEPYVLRYWETEFEVLSPEKTKSGQRVYQRPDIELLLQIRTLLYEEMFTIAGACRQIERRRAGKSSYFDLDEGDRDGAGGTAVAEESELREQLQQARQKLAATQTELDESQNEAAKLQEQFQRVQTALEGTEEQLEAKIEEAEQLQKQFQRVQTALNDTEEQLEAKIEQAEQLQDEKQQLKARLKDAHKQREQRAEQDQNSEKIETLEEYIATLENRLEESEHEAEQRRLALQRAMRDRRQERRQLLSSLRSEVETLETLSEPTSQAAH